MKRGFTMIEVVFVIVVLGILAAIAVPKIAATRDDAEVARIRSDVAAIRSSIVNERQIRLFRGHQQYITRLDDGVAANTDGVPLFDTNGTNRLLAYPIMSKFAGGNTVSGHWVKTGNNQYRVNAGGTDVDFTYTPGTGIFDCNHTLDDCSMLLD